MNSDYKKRNIIFIPGIATKKWMTREWEKELTKKFAEDEVFIINELYFYTQVPKLHNIINNVMEILKNKRETILIGHSFGGILSLIIYRKNLEMGGKNISKIITMASPHQIKVAGLKKIKDELGYSHLILDDLNLETYGGFFDFLVPNGKAKALDKQHQGLFCGHNSFLFNNKIIRKIIGNI